MVMKKTIVLLAVLLAITGQLFPQSAADSLASRNEALNIYLDGSFCDPDYIREELTVVNYVTDRSAADVHVLLNTISTASGGNEYHMIFIGKGRFASHTDTIVFSVPGNVTTAMLRTTILDYLQKGLIPYLMKTPFRDKVSVDMMFDIPEFKETDPWKNWMFEISASGAFNSQKTYRDLGLSSSFIINKTNEVIKFESSNKGEYSRNTFYFDMDDVLDSGEVYTSYDLSSWNLIVGSLGNHFSLGGFTMLRKSTFYNLNFQVVAGPALEFNVFDYKYASDQSLCFLYSLSYEHSNYYDTTVQGRMSDDLFSQQLDINFSYIKEWGRLSAFASASSYLDDLSKYSVGAGALVSLSVVKGLYVDLSLAASYYQDQISLAQDTPGEGDIYTHQREMQTDFSFSASVGISYRFGSIFNNTVNPRFGD
jgi:hypothetical protein